jgi:hypothetical protein
MHVPGIKFVLLSVLKATACIHYHNKKKVVPTFHEHKIIFKFFFGVSEVCIRFHVHIMTHIPASLRILRNTAVKQCKQHVGPLWQNLRAILQNVTGNYVIFIIPYYDIMYVTAIFLDLPVAHVFLLSSDYPFLLPIVAPDCYNGDTINCYEVA